MENRIVKKKNGQIIIIEPAYINNTQVGYYANTWFCGKMIETYYPCGVFDAVQTIPEIVDDFYSHLNITEVEI